MEETDLISAAKAAELLGVSRQTIRAREESGSLVPAEVEWRGAQRRLSSALRCGSLEAE